MLLEISQNSPENTCASVSIFIKVACPSKHFNVGSTLLLGWYDVATSHSVKSTLKQRCVFQRWTTLKQLCVFQCWATLKWRCHFQRRFWQRWGTSKQRCEYDHLKKNIKLWFKIKIIFLSLKEYAGLKTFISPPF